MLVADNAYEKTELQIEHKVVKRPTSRFVHLEKLSLNFSSLSFVIRGNPLNP